MLSTKDIAQYFNVSPRTVIRWIKRGILVAYKTGKDYKVEPDEFEKLKQTLKINNDGEEPQEEDL